MREGAERSEAREAAAGGFGGGSRVFAKLL